MVTAHLTIITIPWQVVVNLPAMPPPYEGIVTTTTKLLPSALAGAKAS